MTTSSIVIDVPVTRIKGRETRTQSIATRFTPSEEQELLKTAEANGQTLREWARDVMLRAAGNETSSDIDQHIFTELVGIQLLLMDTMEPLLRGDKIGPDQVAALFRRSQTAKVAKAQEILAKRRDKREK